MAVVPGEDYRTQSMIPQFLPCRHSSIISAIRGSRSSIFLEETSHGGLTIAALGIVGHSNEENAFTTDTFLALTSPGDLLIDRLGVDQQLSQH